MALAALCPWSLPCQTPLGGLTPAWKDTAAINVATTKRAFRTSVGFLVSPGLLRIGSTWTSSSSYEYFKVARLAIFFFASNHISLCKTIRSCTCMTFFIICLLYIAYLFFFHKTILAVVLVNKDVPCEEEMRRFHPYWKGKCNAVKIYGYTIQFIGKRMNFFFLRKKRDEILCQYDK